MPYPFDANAPALVLSIAKSVFPEAIAYNTPAAAIAPNTCEMI